MLGWSINKKFSAFCNNTTEDGESFCSEHMHYESTKMVRMLNEIGSKVDWSAKSYHIGEGVLLKVMKPGSARKYYQYCPSLEGLLPAWLEQTDHLIRWLKVAFEIAQHEDANSYSKFPVHLVHEAFPEIVDISNDNYYHAFWATYESIKAFGFDKSKPWERNVPTLLHFGGAMQAHIPYHAAVNEQTFQYGDEFIWEAGKQNHTYTKDLFDIDSKEPMPKSPALRMKTNLDGTSSPSYEGIEELKPEVSLIKMI